MNLLRWVFFLFRACPDGEGTWTWKGNGAEGYRRKGKFTQDVVDWYCQSLANCEMAPLVLVDIGGIPSEENHRILREGGVSHAIILAGDMEKVSEWRQFLASCNVEVVAVLHSDYHGTKDSVTSDPMVVHHLERGDESVPTRPAIQAVAEKLMSMIEETSMSNELSFTPLTITALAEAIDKTEEDIPVRGGGTRKGLNWRGEDLVLIADLLHNRSAEMPEVVDVDGPGPGWLVSAIAHECHPREVRLNSPDGYILVNCQKPSGNGSGLDFTVKTPEEGPAAGWTVVEVTLDTSKPLSPDALNDVVPPAVALQDRVILSGRIPNWLMASLAMAYHGRCQAVATFQPGTGSTVCWTHTAGIQLGALIPGNV